jgi:hypothetical protein
LLKKFFLAKLGAGEQLKLMIAMLAAVWQIGKK